MTLIVRICKLLAFSVTTCLFGGCTLDKPPPDAEVAWRLNGNVEPRRTKTALTECGHYSLFENGYNQMRLEERKNAHAAIEQCMFKKGYRLNTGIFFPTYKGFCATDPNLPACQGKDVTIP